MSQHGHSARQHGRFDSLLLAGSLLALCALLAVGVWLIVSGELFRAGPVSVLTLLFAGAAFFRRGLDERGVRRIVHQELRSFEAETLDEDGAAR